VISWTIAAVCVAIFALQLVWGEGNPVLAASRMGALIPSRVLGGEWWRLFSVMLLHGSAIHLALNMLALMSFGPFLEKLIGSARYLLIFVLSGFGGALLSMTRGSEIIGVGASGGIWGVMVAGAVVVTWPRGLLDADMAHQLRQRAWAPVVINLLYSLQPGIDMLAHVGGGVVGGVLVYVLTNRAAHHQPLRESAPFKLAAAVVGVVLAVSFAIALVVGRPWSIPGEM
jgi:membrane associated rhomboid family serine protease